MRWPYRGSDDLNCPFCNAPVADPPRHWNNDGSPVAEYECSTIIDNDGDEERYRTHQCYMNQIRQLQTGGETDYSQGWQDGVAALREIMERAVRQDTHYLLDHPPMRRSETRT